MTKLGKSLSQGCSSSQDSSSSFSRKNQHFKSSNSSLHSLGGGSSSQPVTGFQSGSLLDHHHLDNYHRDSRSSTPHLRLPQLSSSNSSISSWSSRASNHSIDDDYDFLSASNHTTDHHSHHFNPLSASGLCNNNDRSHNGSQSSLSQLSTSSSSSSSQKESYNTRFAKYHLETYRQQDRNRWNFDFDHNKPLDSDNRSQSPSSSRFQWEPAL